MKRILLLSLLMIASISFADPVLIEHVVPQYIGSKSASGTNNTRTPFAVCMQITGLLPNTSYDLQIGVGLVTDAATVYGAGNIWNKNRNQFTGQRDTMTFTTDASGDSGPFWSYIQPTGNGARFGPGQIHNLRIGYTLTGGSFSGNPNFVGTKSFTALDIAITPLTPGTTDDGAFIKGTGFNAASGKYVLIYGDTSGSGNPFSSYQNRNTNATNITQSDLPSDINDIYLQSGTSSAGDFALVCPIGANNPNGIRRVEVRNADNTILYAIRNQNGIYPEGTNTTAIARREVGLIKNYLSVNLKTLVEGFYNDVTDLMVADTVRVFLRNSASPYVIVDSAKTVVNSSGSGTFNFFNAAGGSTYYAVTKHRNSIETWSSAAQSFFYNDLNYDFTAASSSAYGNNLKLKGTRYTIFNGNANGDENINLADIVMISNSISSFSTGYVASDSNGDNLCNLTDLIIAYNNAAAFVTVKRPVSS